MAYVLFMTCVCHAFVFVHCCLVLTIQFSIGLTSSLSFVIVTFLLGILGQVWYLIVSILDPCCLLL